jgi:hypothetical protein
MSQSANGLNDECESGEDEADEADENDEDDGS